MSKFYKPITLSAKHKQLNWINGLVSIHDLQCQCDHPLQHTIIGIIDQEPSLKFDEEDSKKIQKCLTSGDPGTEDVVDAFGDGELEALFAEDDTGEDDTG